MLLGYRGMSFEERAKSLDYNDWNGARDLLCALGRAVDRLEAETFPDWVKAKPLETPAVAVNKANDDNSENMNNGS